VQSEGIIDCGNNGSRKTLVEEMSKSITEHNEIVSLDQKHVGCVTPSKVRVNSPSDTSEIEVTKKSKGNGKEVILKTTIKDENKVVENGMLVARSEHENKVVENGMLVARSEHGHLTGFLEEEGQSEGKTNPKSTEEKSIGEKLPITNPYAKAYRTSLITEYVKKQATSEEQMQSKNDPTSFDVNNLFEIRGISEKANNFAWTIECIVFRKEEIKHYASPNGAGQLLNVFLMDRSGIDIRATFFKNAVSKFDPILEEGRIYRFSNGKVKKANPRFNKTRSQYEIVFDMGCIIEISNNQNKEKLEKSAKERRSFSRAHDYKTIKEQDLSDVVPISKLSRDKPIGWSIVARIIKKSNITNWKKEDGREINVFSLDLMDSSGCDIRACFFNEAIDEFHEELVVGNTYKFSRAYLKDANKAYAQCHSEFELNFSEIANVQLIPDTHRSILLKYAFNYKTLREISELTTDVKVDLVAFVKSVGEVKAKVKFDGSEIASCELLVTDTKNQDATIITVWGENAADAEKRYMNTPVVVFNPVQVLAANDNIILTAVGSVQINPTYPGAEDMISCLVKRMKDE
jgi:hypothetical protein